MKLKRTYVMEFGLDTLDRELDECAGALSVFVGHRCKVARRILSGAGYITFNADERTLKKIKEHMNWMVEKQVKYEISEL